jgi:hypothetical protein
MCRCAPRTDLRLVAVLARIDDRDRPIAETNRRLGVIAEGLGIDRPSYEQVRRLVHALREHRADPTIGQILLDVYFRVRPPEALFEAIGY